MHHVIKHLKAAYYNQHQQCCCCYSYFCYYYYTTTTNTTTTTTTANASASTAAITTTTTITTTGCRLKHESCFRLQPGHSSSLTAPNLQPTANQERNDQCGNQHYSRELLMMGIVVSETC